MEVAMQKEDFFKGINQIEVKKGPYITKYPIFYREVSYLGLFLLAPLNKIRDILPSKRMHPFRLTPWHSIFTITATEYKDSDVGQYNQVSIGIPFTIDRQTPVFTGILHKVPEVPLIYTLHLPVTTEHSRVSGIEMANYPEFLSDIHFSKENNWITCKAGSEGQNILNLSCRVIPVKPFPRQRVFTVTQKDDRLLRSEFNFSDSVAGVSKKQSDVKLEFGYHPVGQKIKDLFSGKVLQYQYYPSGQAILSPPLESYATLM
jgi:hypothetical protein